MDEERGLLDLIIIRLNELSLKEKHLLCESFATEEEFFRRSVSDIETMIGRKLTARESSPPWNVDAMRKQAERDEKAARLNQINWLSWHNPLYPPLLREIYDPPVALFYRGNLPNPEKPLAAMVGTRKPSPYAAAQAYRIAHDLALSGISVISGLALGIDAMAHRGNLEGGAPAVAVLGSGLDKVYPSSNRKLARRILDTGGCLLSEYPPGTNPHKWHFPARNRIISGLARGVLIVEAPQRSGALITARFALEHNRELWVAACGIDEDGPSGSFDRRGSTKLAEDGAGIIRDASDILEAWSMDMAGHEPEETGRLALAASLAHSLGVEL